MPPDNANALGAHEPNERADRRKSIWSVGEPWRWLYFTFFLLLKARGLAVDTRNVKDFDYLDVAVANPWVA